MRYGASVSIAHTDEDPMNTYAVLPLSSYCPVFRVKANTASEALTIAQAFLPVKGIWPIKQEDVN